MAFKPIGESGGFKPIRQGSDSITDTPTSGFKPILDKSKTVAKPRQEEYTGPTENTSTESDLLRGYGVALKQLPQQIYGTGMIIGETLKKGGLEKKVIGSMLSDWSSKGYETASARTAMDKRENDDLTTAWSKMTKEGDIGAMGDFLAYSTGYSLGQFSEAIASSVVGAIAGSALAPGPGTVAGAATGGAASVVGTGIIKKLAMKRVLKMAAKMEARGMAKDLARKKAVKEVAKQIGAGIAVGGFTTTMEAGEIGPGLIETKKKQGKEITGGDLIEDGLLLVLPLVLNGLQTCLA